MRSIDILDESVPVSFCNPRGERSTMFVPVSELVEAWKLCTDKTRSGLIEETVKGVKIYVRTLTERIHLLEGQVDRFKLNSLSDVSTAKLTEELQRREEVKSIVLSDTESKVTLNQNGPAVILVVTD